MRRERGGQAMLKSISNEKDSKGAIYKMRKDVNWGISAIVKDGLSLWNGLHYIYPDIRHGNPQISAITDNEALYWVERVLVYIRYVSKIYKHNLEPLGQLKAML